MFKMHNYATPPHTQEAIHGPWPTHNPSMSVDSFYTARESTRHDEAHKARHISVIDQDTKPESHDHESQSLHVRPPLKTRVSTALATALGVSPSKPPREPPPKSIGALIAAATSTATAPLVPAAAKIIPEVEGKNPRVEHYE